MQTQYTDSLAQALDTELDRLWAARPHLASRIDRAEHILTVHLSCPRQRLIKVRINAKGQPHYLVKGSGGNVYSVDPADWSCSCPDHHRRGVKGCKHSIAVWALMRAATKRPAKAPRMAPEPVREADPIGVLRLPAAGLWQLFDDPGIIAGGFGLDPPAYCCGQSITWKGIS